MDDKTENLSGIKQYYESAIKNKIVVIVLLVLGYVYPLGVYAMWKGNHFKKTTRWIVTAVMIFRFIAVNILLTPNQSTDSFNSSSDCTQVIEKNGCTYYRDSSCNVIARDCS